MNTQTDITSTTDATVQAVTVKIFGVGDAGVKMIEAMQGDEFANAAFAAVNADSRSVLSSVIAEKILLEKKLLRGLGTGGDPETGRAAAEEHLQKLKDSCAGAPVVMIVAGLGGGAGTGISPVLARAARETGALVFGVVTLPFDCEGNRRQQQAAEGLEQLRAAADGVICLPNQQVFKLIDENTSVVETFRRTTGLLLDAVRGLWRLLMHKGLIEIHFDEVAKLLRENAAESSVMAVEASGKTRSAEVIEKLAAHPLLESDALAQADAVIVSLMGGADLTMAEVNRVMKEITKRGGNAEVLMGAAIEESFHEKLSLTVITARGGRSLRGIESRNLEPAASEELETQLLEKKSTGKPASRFVPPAPALTPEQQTQLLSRQSGGRARRVSPRLKQTQLPLEIVHKGRFDKSEPTIHKGEDLDVPTFIRRGVALN